MSKTGQSWHGFAMFDPLSGKLLLRALQGERTRQIPFWLMRQAGRYLPEYRALREKAGSFLGLCFTPEWATEVTLQPIKRFDMDAAILFSDILVVPHALGQELSFVEGEGPRLAAFEEKDIDPEFFDTTLAPVQETVRRVRAELSPEKALIGFAGAPWTVACYMLEGRGDLAFSVACNLALRGDPLLDRLIDRLVIATSRYLLSQIKNGVDAVQLFDSWAGLAPVAHFHRLVIAPTRQIIANIHKEYPGFPVIGFPREGSAFYEEYVQETGISCLGVDQFFSLKEAAQICGGKVAVQGNLDPQVLLQGGDALLRGIDATLKAAGDAPFVFNLGHGVIKETPPEHVAMLAKAVKEYRR